MKKISPTEVLKQWENLDRSEQNSRAARAYARKAGMKSIAEVRCAAWLEKNNIPYGYEVEKWVYQHAPQKYTPDFCMGGPVIEVKGKMTADVRKKLLSVKKSNPDKVIYLVFERASNKIRGGSKTTYGMWADNNDFDWSEVVPKAEWFKRGRMK